MQEVADTGSRPGSYCSRLAVSNTGVYHLSHKCQLCVHSKTRQSKTAMGNVCKAIILKGESFTVTYNTIKTREHEEYLVTGAGRRKQL